MRRYLRPSALTVRCRLGDYTRAMMIKRILTICAAVAASAAGTSLASAQGYLPPGAVYSPAPAPYPPGGYPADYRRGPGAPDFDALDDDEAPNAQSSTALPPPGPVLSPDDPRYGRPEGARPVYSDRGAPTGPILSPDDPRYGRPDGARPVYSDRGVPTGPILSPDDPRYGRPDGPPPVIYSDRGNGNNRVPEGNGAPRPPEALGAASNAPGSVQPPFGADGKP